MNSQKITFGEMRRSGVRRVLVYCRNYHCNHHSMMNADRWPDQLRLSDVEPRLICHACGNRGSEIHPGPPPVTEDAAPIVEALPEVRARWDRHRSLR